MILHFTNGDIAAERLKTQFPGDVVVPWRDVLHDGPVPPGLALEQLSEVRARFLAEAGWGTYHEAITHFRRRDKFIANALQFYETALWFERDLYDTLQLLQILAFFEQNMTPLLTIVPVIDYLGNTPPMGMKVLFPQRKQVRRAQLESAAAAWEAFRDPDPRAMEAHFEDWPALVRLCEEHPWTTDGLSRSERVLKRLQDEGLTRWRDLFVAYSREEDEGMVWRGDASFVRFLNGARDRNPNYLWDPDARRFRLRAEETPA